MAVVGLDKGSGVLEIAAIAGGGALAGILIGGLLGFRIADKRLKRLYEEVRGEVFRLRGIAKEKLSSEEPDLDTLLRSLNNAVQDTFKAAAALEHHEKVVTRQHEGGKEVIASSRHIIRMIDELAGDEPEPMNPVKAPPAPKLNDDDAGAAKPPMRHLR